MAFVKVIDSYLKKKREREKDSWPYLPVCHQTSLPEFSSQWQPVLSSSPNIYPAFVYIRNSQTLQRLLLSHLYSPASSVQYKEPFGSYHHPMRPILSPLERWGGKKSELAKDHAINEWQSWDVTPSLSKSSSSLAWHRQSQCSSPLHAHHLNCLQCHGTQLLNECVNDPQPRALIHYTILLCEARDQVWLIIHQVPWHVSATRDVIS